MKTTKLITLGLLSIPLLVSGCATRYSLLSTPAVSMSDAAFETGYTAKDSGAINTRYCRGDDPVSSSSKDSYQIGLMDEVIAKAQKESGARYIANAQFFSEGSCVVLEGTAMK